MINPFGHTVRAAIMSLWAYRGFILSSVRREFQTKYRNSLFGAAWLILNPLARILIFTLVFSKIMRTRLPDSDSVFAYSIYLCAGVLTWDLLATIINRSQTVFIEHANLIKKINFPRICLPVIVVISSVIEFAIIFIMFILFLVFTGAFPGWVILSIFPLLIIHILFAVGLGLSIGVVNVFFRDFGHIWNILVNFWFWLTPVVYPAVILPEKFRVLVPMINPMAPMIAGFQNIFVNARQPVWQDMIMPLGVTLIVLLLGIRLYRKWVDEMVDEL